MKFLWDITIGLIFRILFSPSPTRYVERDDTEVEHWVTQFNNWVVECDVDVREMVH